MRPSLLGTPRSFKKPATPDLASSALTSSNLSPSRRTVPSSLSKSRPSLLPYNNKPRQSLVSSPVVSRIVQIPPDDYSILKKELEEAKRAINEKDVTIRQQNDMLAGLQDTIGEFNGLVGRDNQNQGIENRVEQQQQEIDNLCRILEEKERKFAVLKSEFEEKRREFRTTIDSLQEEIQQSSQLYENEIRSLSESASQASIINGRIRELEQMVSSLESGLHTSQISEQEARTQLSRMADVENRLLEKEQELRDATVKLDRTRNLISTSGGSGGDPAMIVELSTKLHEKDSELNSLRDLLKKQAQKFNDSSDLELENKLAEAENELVKLKQSFETNVEQHKVLDQQQLDLQTSLQEIDILKDELVESKAKISQLEAQVMDLQKQEKTSRSKIANLQSDKNELENKLATQGSNGSNDSLAALKYDLEQERATRKELENELSNLEAMLESKILNDDEEFEQESSRMPQTPVRMNSNDSGALQEVPIYQSPKKIDPTDGRVKWCALCEREGHVAMDCPYEQEF